MRSVATAVGIGLACVLPASAQIGNPAGMAPDTRFESPGVPAPGSTNYQDRLFARLAAAGGMAEVEFGRLALDKAANERVREFAQRMVDDHGAANDRLKGLAEDSRIPLPDELAPDHRWMRSELESKEGADFDLAYIGGQITDHQKTATLLQWEIGQGQEAAIQRFAAETLPTVLEHLRIARDIKAELSRLAAAEPAPAAEAAPEPAAEQDDGEPTPQ